MRIPSESEDRTRLTPVDLHRDKNTGKSPRTNPDPGGEGRAGVEENSRKANRRNG